MYVMRPFQCVDDLHVHHMADDVILICDPIRAMHVSADARYIKRLSGAVAFHQADHFWRHFVGVAQPADPQAGLQAQRDLGLHLDQFFLHQLVSGKWPAELVTPDNILTGFEPAILRSP